jgi:DNA-binding transcriptional regulator YiaG
LNREWQNSSNRIKSIRQTLNISQEDLARQLGVSYATVNRWENNQSKPSKLAKARLDSFCEKMNRRGKLIWEDKK